MTKEPRNIPATKGNAKATLTKDQIEVWEKDGWSVMKPSTVKGEAKSDKTKT